MKETSKITYDFGKLKRFLTVVRLLMQDTLLSLVKRCYNDYYDFIRSFIPKEVTINSSSDVINRYDLSDKSITWRQRPLFTLDLNKHPSKDKFKYSTKAKNFVNTLMVIFDKALEDVSKIPNLEPKILADLYKS